MKGVQVGSDPGPAVPQGLESVYIICCMTCYIVLMISLYVSNIKFPLRVRDAETVRLVNEVISCWISRALRP